MDLRGATAPASDSGGWPPEAIGEPGGIRTHDPLIKSQMLYRLSYGLSGDHMGRCDSKAILRVALLNNPKCGIPA